MSIKRLLLVTMCAASFIVSASAQRSGGAAHGGLGGHSGAIGGGFNVVAPHSFANSPRFTGSRPLRTGSRPTMAAPAFRANNPTTQGRRNGQGTTGYRRPYEGDRRHVPYFGGPWVGVSGVSFIGYPGGLGLDDGLASSNDNSAFNGNDQAPNPDGSQGALESAPDPGQPMPYPQYPAYAQEAPSPPSPPAREPQPEDAVTLVFKDGRPAEQIHNYMLTSTTLYIRDQHHSEIPLTELDLAATEKVNRAAGVDFELVPKTP